MGGEHNGGAHGEPGRCTARLRSYANDLAVQFSLSEIEMQFGQRFGPGEAVSVHSWIVATPVHLVTFGRVIAATIAAYERRYGAIPVSDDRAQPDPGG